MIIALLAVALAGAGPFDGQMVSRVDAGITYTLATDRGGYARFEPIVITYTVENGRSEPVTFSFDSAEQTVVRIGPASCTALDQPGCREVAIYDFPQIVHFNDTEFTLTPGASRIFTTLWDQRRNTGNTPTTGEYRLVAALLAATPAGELGAVPGTELSLPLTIGDMTTAAEIESWGGIKSRYR